jgi:hypothetical protein
MSITFNSPSSDSPGQSKPSKPEKKEDPASQAKQRQKEHLQKQQEQLQKKLERLSDSLRRVATLILAQNPNDDPQYLFKQVRPLLSSMRLANIADAGKTELIVGKTDPKGNSLYQVLLRRTAEITPDIIDHIKREEKNLEYIKWSSNGMEACVWEKYVPPETI